MTSNTDTEQSARLLSLHERLAFLERCLRAVFLFCFLLAGLILLSAFAGNEREEPVAELRVRRLAVVDESGVARLVIGAPTPDPMIAGKQYPRRTPSYGFQLNDAQGNEIGGLGTTDDGVANLCFDDGRHERVCLFLFGKGRSGLLVNDAQGRKRAWVGLDTPDGPATVEVLDAEGKSVGRLGEPSPR